MSIEKADEVVGTITNWSGDSRVVVRGAIAARFQAALDQPLQWQDGPPTELGWYVVVVDNVEIMEPVIVYAQYLVKRKAISYKIGDIPCTCDASSVIRHIGPIPEPEKPKPEPLCRRFRRFECTIDGLPTAGVKFGSGFICLDVPYGKTEYRPDTFNESCITKWLD